jgi:light-regulated signal transduction histidine kinase (bacteriophytochrome)
MGQLIDDLLDFSRVGRKEIIKTPHHVEDLVHSVFNELIEQDSTRQVEFVVSKLESSTADIRMMRQVWLNIISNALKYTQKNSVTKIEVSSYRESRRIVYSVKDNGVGFDMQYVGKLFGVFQRLHKVQDFEGTGVGLAIVKRIMDKHGGQVWVNSKINEGATFYFSLPVE